MIHDKNEYLFFWNGIYSQWYPSTFYDFSGKEYNCAEQYMMAEKARLFGDDNILEEIMATPLPNEQKALGKKVKRFDLETWQMFAVDIVTKGNYFKFTQNELLFAELQMTGTRHIVEASPHDPVWGIGIGEDFNGIEDQSNWQGTNWLGIAIMRVRVMLFGLKCRHEGCMNP